MSTPPPLRTTKETHPNLPPGLILGPDGKVCKVCNSWQDWGKTKIKKKSETPSTTTPSSSSSSTSASSSIVGLGGFGAMMTGKRPNPPKSPSPSSTPQSEPDSTPYSASTPQQLDRQDCPADTVLLGRSTWTFLHTTAAYYPLTAPPSTQRNMLALLGSLSVLYPCAPCAEDFREDTRVNPPDVSGREGLMRWLCERHNVVNEKLGKESFDCGMKSLGERWKDGPGDGRCD